MHVFQHVFCEQLLGIRSTSWRLELRPGNQKKGQAVRHCLKIFAEQANGLELASGEIGTCNQCWRFSPLRRLKDGHGSCWCRRGPKAQSHLPNWARASFLTWAQAIPENEATQLMSRSQSKALGCASFGSCTHCSGAEAARCRCRGCKSFSSYSGCSVAQLEFWTSQPSARCRQKAVGMCFH